MEDITNEQMKSGLTKSVKLNKRAVKALVIPFDRKSMTPLTKQMEDKDGKSKELPEDPFEQLIKAGQVLEPPFELLTLAMLNEHSSELGQCVEAMACNIDGFGHRYIPRVKADPEKEDIARDKAALKERTDLKNFFNYVCLDDSFTGFRKKIRTDLEMTGNAWYEVIRNLAGKIQGFNHLPSYQMRLGIVETNAVKVPMKVIELQEDGSAVVKEIQVWKRFRLHAQSKGIHFRNMMVSSSFTLRWFKEFGDPRVYDYESGDEIKGDDLKDFPEDRKANEIIHLRYYSARSPYGLPRFVGNMLDMFGDRAAGEINYITFQNNNVPSMALTVSNGQLTEGTVKRIESFVESQIQGSDNYSKFLIIEGETSEIDGEDAGQVKIDIVPLVKEQHTDELFQNYSKNNQDKVRRAFRLPPLFVGRADDYSRATAESSRRVADEQIFAPERSEFDSHMNRIMFPEMGIVHHEFKSNSPNTTDNAELVRILAGSEKTGGMTPRIARSILEDILGVELPPFPKDFPADEPFSMTMAEAVKNKADPTEPGQQVTALKMVDDLTKSDISLYTEEDIVERLIKANQLIEERWREETKFTEE